jgi:hypothetical protein
MASAKWYETLPWFILLEPTLCQVLQTLERYNPSIVALDGNLSPDMLKTLLRYCNENEIKGK